MICWCCNYLDVHQVIIANFDDNNFGIRHHSRLRHNMPTRVVINNKSFTKAGSLLGILQLHWVLLPGTIKGNFCSKPLYIGPYLIFVLFCTLADSKGWKLYTEKCANLRQKLSRDKTAWITTEEQNFTYIYQTVQITQYEKFYTACKIIQCVK